MSESPSLPLRTSKWKMLLGFLPENEALSFGASQGVPFDQNTQQAVREALDYAKSLTGRKGQMPRSKPIPQEQFQERETKLRNEPTFREHLIGISDASFRMVEIGRLHTFQHSINLEYTNRLVKEAPPRDNLRRLIEFCLPLREDAKNKQQLPVGFNPTTNTYTVASENLDMRILGQVQGEDPPSGRKFLGFFFGGGLPQMSVIEYKGLVMIKNGYHRAYALLEKGHEFMPVLYLKTDSYQNTGANQPGFLPYDVLSSERSPTMNDFFSKAAVTYDRPLTRIIISIHGEAQIVTV